LNDEQSLIDKLRRIETLFARAGTAGEKAAAASAADRIRSRLREVAAVEPPTEYRFTVADGWSRKLLLALLRRTWPRRPSASSPRPSAPTSERKT
jgi:hypothetical protein